MRKRIKTLIKENNQGVTTVHVKDEDGKITLEEYPNLSWDYSSEDYEAPDYNLEENAEHRFIDFCNQNKLYVINKNILDTSVRESLHINRLIYHIEENKLYRGNEDK